MLYFIAQLHPQKLQKSLLEQYLCLYSVHMEIRVKTNQCFEFECTNGYNLIFTNVRLSPSSGTEANCKRG